MIYLTIQKLFHFGRSLFGAATLRTQSEERSASTFELENSESKEMKKCSGRSEEECCGKKRKHYSKLCSNIFVLLVGFICVLTTYTWVENQRKGV